MRPSFPKKIQYTWQTAALTMTALFAGVNGHCVAAITLAQASTDKPNVVATTSFLCDVAKQIAKETINLKCLIDAGADPHEYQPKPGDRKAIDQAKLILYAGYNFEPKVIKLVTATSNSAPKIAVDEDAVPNPQWFVDDGRRVVDPHVFHNAQNGIRIAKVIAKNLTKLQPNQAALYTENTQKLADELTQIHDWIKSEIGTIPTNQRKLVTTHDAFGYYSQAYGIPLAGALQGVSTDEEVRPVRLAELVKSIRESQVPTIFVEATTSPRLMRAVAREAKVKVSNQELFADGIGEKGTEADSYPKMLIANTKSIVEGLGGKYTAFQFHSNAASQR
ncbi:MAG: zinc ABC transporter substrate-binding protein [Rhizonema sp. PD38]|nr:zinc ABC transporter substrate-binding protein [Rhizonema sp. PD38]